MRRYQKLGKRDAIEPQGYVLAGNKAQYLAWIEDNGLSSTRFPRLSSPNQARSRIPEFSPIYLVGSWYESDFMARVENAIPPNCRLLLTFLSWEYEEIE